MSNPDLSLDAYDYELPQERIAQNPVEPRDCARFLVVSSPQEHQHRIFRELPELLRPNDLLVLNDTRVLPARLYGEKPSGAKVEVLLLEAVSQNRWLALVKPGKRLKPGASILFSPPSNPSDHEFSACVVSVDDKTGGRVLEFQFPEDKMFLEMLEEYGEVPFPPYVTQSQASPNQYQTVYARQAGSAAAPTAGLHFTNELFDRLDERGVRRAFVTLHVGVGTFRPVEVSDITQHAMHEEWAKVPHETVEAIREAKARGGRIIAVGTTAVRSLEAAVASSGDRELEPFCGKTDLFIYPGYRWRLVEGLITNFHLPKSSLMMLVSSLVGRERLLTLYREAIAQNYRFFSFGDAMFVTPEANQNPPGDWI
ncbi:S-adenosylmethionine:tRNA ribosyltransferase-isomerase [Geitlerinema sp. FC II]|uniref:tRNA preQ1(34) S-adenosylmethionine ribosyltransferase-isomerase QueA n=1 Tax=Baaleninema simplex TaxID=2862350 RepID=UPI00034AC691|nr:tRNA preQ1(34) S-adenosylmethionine ribosyltransferase-isomerase QueA [Baaleninema simplex]MDC0832867.1 tRNA preQ1(34) S-adenosylmethionine ribosyltransferase-isomerase QueA [Geitlerinema sp. CS-897]PPT05742.1 S-adenosylmethionine:tRNA ribosyltransferase-isomerase [Geitlerinema sp. FC II]